MIIEDFLSSLDRPRRVGRNWMVKCPAHADRSPSLSVTEGGAGKIVLRCFSGCSAAEIVSAMGLKLSDLFPDEKPDREKLRTATRKRDREKQRERLDREELAVRFRAEQLIESTRGIDISKWSEAELDAAMSTLGDAYQVLWPENLEGYLNGGF